MALRSLHLPVCATALSFLTACPHDDEGKGPDTGIEAGAGYEIDELPLAASCTSAPSERRFAHMAAFAVHEPFTLAGTTVGYGFLLHGGIDSTGALSDMWVYDLSVDETVTCPWTYIMDTAVPLWGGSAAWDATSERFMVAGGVLEGTTSERASGSIRVFDPRSPTGGLVSINSLAGQAGTVLQLGDADCEGGEFWHESVDDECGPRGRTGMSRPASCRGWLMTRSTISAAPPTRRASTVKLNTTSASPSARSGKPHRGSIPARARSGSLEARPAVVMALATTWAGRTCT